MTQLGRPSKIQPQHLEILRKMVAENPVMTQAEVMAEFRNRTGLSVSQPTMAKALKDAGIVRQKGPPPVAPVPKKPDRFGYTEQHRLQLPEQNYPSSLTDAEWALVRDLFEHEGGRGLPPEVPRRTMLDACCYVARTGCSWRMLPKEFPAWTNVYKTFRRWSEAGLFEAMHERLRQQWRQREERNPSPTTAIIDAQSTRTSPQGGTSGYDAGKKVKGRKRHLVVDSCGLLLAVVVTAACVQDRDGGIDVMAESVRKFPTLERVYADSAYAGTWAKAMEDEHGLQVKICRHLYNRNVGRLVIPEQESLFQLPNPAEFVTQAMRWVVERTHAWVERSRRLVMHHDRLAAVSVAWVWLAEARMLVRRVAHPAP